jgi:hypothetical protein
MSKLCMLKAMKYCLKNQRRQRDTPCSWMTSSILLKCEFSLHWSGYWCDSMQSSEEMGRVGDMEMDTLLALSSHTVLHSAHHTDTMCVVGVFPHQAILQQIPARCSLIQFWHYLPQGGIRSHRLKAQSQGLSSLFPLQKTVASRWSLKLLTIQL